MKFFFLIGLWICLPFVLSAQFRLDLNRVPTAPLAIDLRYSRDTGYSLTDETLQSIQPAEWKRFDHLRRMLARGARIWISVSMDSLKKYQADRFMMIRNPHIDFLCWWIVKEDSILFSIPPTGDHFHFGSRPVDVEDFVFPLPEQIPDGARLIFVADKRSSELEIPLHFYNDRTIFSGVQNRAFLFGLLIGFYILLIIFNLLLSVYLKEAVYGWYAVYLSVVLIYFLSDAGSFFRYVNPAFPEMNDIFRPSIFAAGILPLYFFFSHLLRMPEVAPRLNRFNNYLFGGYFGLLVIAVVHTSFSGTDVRFAWLQIHRVISPLVLLTLMLESVYGLIKGYRFSIFAVLGNSSLALSFIVFSFYLNGLLPDILVTHYANYIGMFLDACIMAFSLVWRYKTYQKDAADLSARYLEQQKNITREISKWQERDMTRLASILHDNLGADIGLLRLKADSMPLTEEKRKELSENLMEIGNQIRGLSHQFSPIILRKKGLYESVRSLIVDLQRHTGIAMQFEWIGERNVTSYQNAVIIYRIVQELLQNMWKHAQATEGFLQVMYQSPHISIYIEDNGVGSAVHTEEGIGIASIRSLVELMEGRLSIDTKAGAGYVVSIEFLSFDEK
jgi:signal transduction histidine kinase